MHYRLLGHTGLRVSEAALGTMTFGTDWGWGADIDETRKIFDAYAGAGGNFVDTADRYTNGTAEKMVGEFVRADRDKFVVASKYTLSSRPDDPNAAGNHRKNLVQSLDASLRRMGTDYLDVYWVHIWDRLTPIEEMMRALDDVVRAGKVLYIGISDAPAWVVARANTLAEERGWTPFAAIQVQYSLIERSVERELLPMARDLDIAVTAWAALGSGILTGKYNKDRSGGGGRIDTTGSSNMLTERSLAIAGEVVTLAAEIGVSPSQVALAWVRQQAGVVIPIIGATKLSQLVDNLSSLDVHLTAEQLERLDKASAIELGFPHDFSNSMNAMVFGEAGTRVRPHR
jgi:aryl-alcohol dehydrogenase-like predicted oxidoreductase